MLVDLMKQIIMIVLGADAYIVTAAPSLMPTPTPTAAPTTALSCKFLISMHDHITKRFLE
jgi:hypothetical protein